MCSHVVHNTQNLNYICVHTRTHDRRIGYDISCTCAKLEKLTERKSITCDYFSPFSQCLYHRSTQLTHALYTDLSLSLSRLLLVTRRRTLFSDPGNEIQELTQVIKQDLAKLNSDIAELQQQVKSKSGRDNKHVRTHSSSVVVSLQVYRVE